MPTAVLRFNAHLNQFRLNGARLGDVRPKVWIYVGGRWDAAIRMDSMTLTDGINDEPNTLAFRMEGPPPVPGAGVSLWLGPHADDQWAIFAGNVLSVQALYESLPKNLAYDVQCIDYSWLLKRRLVQAQYVNLSATQICVDLIQRFAPSFGSGAVGGGLPVIPEISFVEVDLPNALSRVMEAIGGYWYVDAWRNVHAFLDEGDAAAPILQDAPRTMSAIAQTVDYSQVSNRIYARGGGSQATADCSPVDQGDLATIPVEDVGWYSTAGGMGEVGSQRFTYDTTFGDSGTGSVILGDTVSVQAAPAAAPPVPNDPGRLVGTYSYKTTFVSKEGESMASPPSAPAIAGVVPIVSTMRIDHWSSTTVPPMPTGSVCRYVVTFVTSQGETLASAPCPPCAPTPPPFQASGYTNYYSVQASAVPLGPPGTTARKLYRSDNGGPFGYTWTIPGNTATYPSGGDYETPGAAPPLPTAGFGKLAVSAIAVGGTTGAIITARNLYRTKGDGTSIFYRVTTIRDNTTTTYLDNVADANLGDEEPARGTLGTLPGSTQLRVSAIEAFVGHGWVYAANQLLRYNGRSPENGPGTFGPGALINIPASGVGSITSPLSVDTEVMNAPMLAGVRAFGFQGLQYPVLKGDAVAVLAIVDDAASQAAMAAAVGSGDGVHELFIGDSGWMLTEAQARAAAELKRRKDGLTSITFESRDDSIWSGRTIAISLSTPAIGGTFRIRRVTITQFGHPHLWPLRRVEVSSQRFSFEDLLRQTRGEK